MKKVNIVLIIFISTIFTPFINVFASDNSYNILEGSSYKLPNDDLNALKPILKDKEIIGVGEATHGTKEFFEMKHRLFKFLVEEMDFKVFAMEESMSNMELINEYILGKDYKLDKLMSNLLAPWQTKEMMDLINWAKEYNNKVSKENKIRFYGFDSQENNDGLETILKNYYDKVDSLSFKEMYKKN
ncbi:MAG: erythromycin esterase family protein [Clostridium baratii]|uniref:erythromycin esterase family protein n=1 Tax=Clostridium baratii TaxID=1561 RepID=UPI00242EBC02|nr:erythromycin esterase family protein [Clostridium baratii]MBS6006169.1 erythromycin esterase family protein [Clostridium baratii]MDU1053242.1 erythromycin esterase family protein [Clostridium baratii]